MAQQMYTITADGIYRSADKSKNFRLYAGDQISMEMAVELGLPGAYFAPAPSPFDAQHEARIEDLVFTPQKRGLVDPNPGMYRLLPLPGVMTSPPTITENAASTISGSILYAPTSGAFRVLGSGPLSLVNTDYYMTTGREDGVGRVPLIIEFDTDAQNIELVTKQNGFYYRLMVDGQYVASGLTKITGTDGARMYFKFAFGSTTPRRIRFEAHDFWFAGIRVQRNDSVWVPSSPTGPRVVVLGDSFVHGTGATVGNPLDGFVYRFSQRIGWADTGASGIGGSGYLNPGPYQPYRTRVQSDVLDRDPDIVIVEGSWNDRAYGASAVATEAALLYDAIRSGRPSATLIALLPFECQAESGCDAGLIANRDAMAPVAEQYAHLVIDPLADGWFTGTGKSGDATADGNSYRLRGSDAVHPTAQGHVYIGERLAQAISAALPL